MEFMILDFEGNSIRYVPSHRFPERHEWAFFGKICAKMTGRNSSKVPSKVVVSDFIYLIRVLPFLQIALSENKIFLLMGSLRVLN